jgi:hypothetical protein
MASGPRRPGWARTRLARALAVADFAILAMARALDVPDHDGRQRPARDATANLPPPHPPPHPPAILDTIATTVVAISAWDAAESPSHAIATLAELATRHELVIVYGRQEAAAGTLSPPALIEAIRARLPRFKVAAVLVDAYPRLDPTDCVLLEELLADGTLPVAVVHAADPVPTARALATRLSADLTLRLGYDRGSGARLRTLTESAFPVPG